MKVFIHSLVIILVALLRTRSEELVIYSSDGDVIECVKLDKQPAFSNALLQNHTIHLTPTGMRHVVETEDLYGWQTWHHTGTRCPIGSIPIKVNHRHDVNTTSRPYDRQLIGHEHAVGLITNSTKISGSQATMSVWSPNVENPKEFSLGQIWITSGSYDASDINSIEAGWQVSHGLYSDYQPRLFIYWTTDAYVDTGCYNLRCGAFVQISRIVMIEGAIFLTSTFGGAQADLTIRIWMDHKLRCWWLGVVIGHDVLLPVGYWPSLLFTLQTDYATQIQWGGEIINLNISGSHTKTQMGSGYLPESGLGRAAYMRNLKIALSENVFEPVLDIETLATDPDHYRVQKWTNREFGTHLYYGGPKHYGELERARADDLSWNSPILYICFGLLVLI